MASDTLSLGDLTVNRKIMDQQLRTVEKDIIAFQKRIDKLLKWKLTIDDSQLRRRIGAAMNEFDKLDRKANQVTGNLAKSLSRSIPNFEGLVAKQSAAIHALYAKTLESAKQFGAGMLGETAKYRSQQPNIPTGGRRSQQPSAGAGGSADLLARQTQHLQAQENARVAQEIGNRRLILAAEKQLSAAKVALLRQEVVEVRKTEAERLAAVKGEASAEIKIRTDAARQIAAKERQIQAETRRDQNRGRGRGVGNLRIGEDISAVMNDLRSGNIAGLAATAFGPWGAAAGAAFDIIKAGFSAVIDASNEFNNNVARSTRLLVGNTKSIADLDEAMQMVRFSSRETGQNLNDMQGVFELLIGSVPALQNNMDAVAKLTDKIGKGATGMGTSTQGLTIAMTGLANSFGRTLESEEDQAFILDRIARLMIDGVIPNADQMSNAIGRAATNVASLAPDWKTGINTLEAFNATLTLNGINVEIAQDKINDLTRVFQRTKITSAMAAAGLEGIDQATGKIDFGKVFASASKDIEKFVKFIPNANANAQMVLRMMSKDGGKVFNDMMKNAEGATGTMGAQFGKMQGTAKNNMDILKANFNDLLVTMGQGASNASSGIVGSMSSAISWINDLLSSAEALNQRAQSNLKTAREASTSADELISKLDEALETSGKEGYLAAIKQNFLEIEALGGVSAQVIDQLVKSANAASPENIALIRKEMENIAALKAAESIVALTKALETSSDAVKELQEFEVLGGARADVESAGGETAGLATAKQTIDSAESAINKLIDETTAKLAQATQAGDSSAIVELNQKLASYRENDIRLTAQRAELNAQIRADLSQQLQAMVDSAQLNGESVNLESAREQLVARINEMTDEGQVAREYANNLADQLLRTEQERLQTEDTIAQANADINGLLESQLGTCDLIALTNGQNKEEAIATIEAYILQKEAQAADLQLAKGRLITETFILEKLIQQAEARGDVIGAIANTGKMVGMNVNMAAIDAQIKASQTSVGVAKDRLASLKGEKKATNEVTDANQSRIDSEEELTEESESGSKKRRAAKSEEEKQAEKASKDAKKREEDIANALDKINADRYQSETKRKAAGMDETEAKLYEEQRRYEDQLADLRREFGNHAGLMAAATALHAENIAGIEEDAMLKAKEKADELEKEKFEKRKEIGDQIAEMAQNEANAQFEIKEGQIAREIRAETDKYSELIKQAKKFGADVQTIEKIRFQGMMRIYRSQITELTTSITGTMQMIFPKSALMASVDELNAAFRARIGQTDTITKLSMAQAKLDDANRRLTENQNADFRRQLREAQERRNAAQAALETEAIRMAGGGAFVPTEPGAEESNQRPDPLGVARGLRILRNAIMKLEGQGADEQINVSQQVERLKAEMKTKTDALERAQARQAELQSDIDRGVSSRNRAQIRQDIEENQKTIDELTKQIALQTRAVEAAAIELSGTETQAILGQRDARILSQLMGEAGGEDVAEVDRLSPEKVAELKALWAEYKTSVAEAIRVTEEMTGLDPELGNITQEISDIHDEMKRIADEAPGETLVATVSGLDNWLAKLALVINEHRVLRDEIRGINQQYDNVSDEKQEYFNQLENMLNLRRRVGSLTAESSQVLGQTGRLEGADVSSSRGIRANVLNQISAVTQGAAIAKNEAALAMLRRELTAAAAKESGIITGQTIIDVLNARISEPATTFAIVAADEFNKPHSPPVGVKTGTDMADTFQQRHERNLKAKAGAKNLESGTFGMEDIMNMLLTDESRDQLIEWIRKAGEEFVAVAEETAEESAKLFQNAFRLIEAETKRVISQLNELTAASDQRAMRGTDFEREYKAILDQFKADRSQLNQVMTDSIESEFQAKKQLNDNHNELQKKDLDQTTRNKLESEQLILKERVSAEKQIQADTRNAMERLGENSGREIVAFWARAITKVVQDIESMMDQVVHGLATAIDSITKASRSGDTRDILGAIGSTTGSITSAAGSIASMFPGLGPVIGQAISGVGAAVAGIVGLIAEMIGGEMSLTEIEQATRENAKINALLEARKQLMADLVAFGNLQVDTTREQSKFVAEQLKLLERGRFGVGGMTNQQVVVTKGNSDEILAALNYKLVQAKKNAEQAGLFDKAFYEDQAKQIEDAIAMEQLRNDSLGDQVQLRKELRELVTKQLQDEAALRDIQAEAGIAGMTRERAARENLRAINELIAQARAGAVTDAAGNKVQFTPEELVRLQSDAEKFRTQAEDARRNRQEFQRESLRHQQEMTGIDTSEQVKDSLKAQIAQEKTILAQLHGNDQIIEQKRVIMQLEKQLLDMQKDKNDGMDKELALLTKQREQLLMMARADRTVSGQEKAAILDIQDRIRARLVEMGVDPTDIERILANMNMQAFEQGGWTPYSSSGVPVIVGEGNRPERIVSADEVARFGGPSAFDAMLASRYSFPRMNSFASSVSNSQSFGNVNISGSTGEDIWRQLEPRMRKFWSSEMRNHEKARGQFRG